MKSKNLSEFLLIDRIANKFGKHKNDVLKGIGDDTAVVKVNKNKYLLYTCDSLVSGIHFSEKYSTSYQIGRKAAAVNISDIAAMGGQPNHCLVSLFLPENTTKKFIDELYLGLIEECNLYDIDIIGGNIAKSGQFIIDLFLIGEVPRQNLLLRSGAKVGDLVLVTGNLGDSAAGLKLLQNPQLNISEKDKKRLISRHLTPIPRIKEAMLISKSKKATSMIDISDGLSSDLLHICQASQVGVKLFADKIPVSDSVKIDLALNGGEDYELCFTLPVQYAFDLSDKLKKETATKVTIIGEIIPKIQGKWLINNAGEKFPLTAKGWDHFL
jgi:thiamine-monophosphate kinase